jgi:ATP-binding cassette subfamily F protein 3
VKQEAQRSHMEAFVERFRAKASKAKQAQSRLKALQKLKPISAHIEDHVMPFHFPEPEKVVASPIIAIESGEVGYTPGKPILKHLNLRIDADDRIALLGSNGNGKSTLAKLIGGRLPLQKGKITVAPNLKISFFAQHQLDDLIPEDNAIEHVRKLMPDAPESKVRARVSRMGLATVKMNTAAKDLSGGEKARLLMGLATFQGPNLLILDEPTNHLDIDSREALMHALNDFDGAVILIAHDRHLIEATMDRLWLVRDGGVAPYDGDLDAYRSLVLADAKAERSGNKIVVEEGQKLSKAEQRKLAAQKREALKPLQKKIQEAEAQVHRFQKKIDSLQIQLADPVIYTREPAKATQIGKEIGYAKSSLARAEEEWLTLSGEYEEAMTELAQ